MLSQINSLEMTKQSRFTQPYFFCADVWLGATRIPRVRVFWGMQWQKFTLRLLYGEVRWEPGGNGSCFGGSQAPGKKQWWPMRAMAKNVYSTSALGTVCYELIYRLSRMILSRFSVIICLLSSEKNNSHCIRKWISSPSLGHTGSRIWPNLQDIQLQYWTRISSWGAFNIRGKPAQILQVTILMIVHSNSIHIILYLMMQWFNTHIITYFSSP